MRPRIPAIRAEFVARTKASASSTTRAASGGLAGRRRAALVRASFSRSWRVQPAGRDCRVHSARFAGDRLAPCPQMWSRTSTARPAGDRGVQHVAERIRLVRHRPFRIEPRGADRRPQPRGSPPLGGEDRRLAMAEIGGVVDTTAARRACGAPQQVSPGRSRSAGGGRVEAGASMRGGRVEDGGGSRSAGRRLGSAPGRVVTR